MRTFYTAALTIFLVVLNWSNVSVQGKGIYVNPQYATVGVAHGPVYGARHCGGPAEFKELRIQGCEPSSPCKPKVPGNLMSDIDFIPVIDMNGMEIRVHTAVEGEEMDWIWTYHLGGEIKKGEKQTVTIFGTGERYFAGKKVKEMIEFLSYHDQSLQLCVVAEFEYVLND